MERLGLKVGASLDIRALHTSVKSALSDGVRAGLEEIRNYTATQSKPRDGWSIHPGEIGVIGNDYLGIATIAMVGLGAKPAEDAIYPLNISDAKGDPAVCENRYTIHFATGLLPPVGGFWSVTMYDKTYDGAAGYLVENPINRYLINSTTEGLVYDEHGSLTSTIQHAQPQDDAARANWLPAPDGPFALSLRNY